MVISGGGEGGTDVTSCANERRVADGGGGHGVNGSSKASSLTGTPDQKMFCWSWRGPGVEKPRCGEAQVCKGLGLEWLGCGRLFGACNSCNSSSSCYSCYSWWDGSIDDSLMDGWMDGFLMMSLWQLFLHFMSTPSHHILPPPQKPAREAELH